METAAEWGVSLVFWLSLLFIAVVSTFWRWWHYPFGRAFMTFDVFMTITLFPSVLGLELGVPVDNKGWQWETIFGFFAIACAIPWKTWVLFRVQAAPEGKDILTNRQGWERLTELVRRQHRDPGTG